MRLQEAAKHSKKIHSQDACQGNGGTKGLATVKELGNMKMHSYHGKVGCTI